jgi:hypothetical protein
MRVFPLRIVAAKKWEEAPRGVLAGAGEHRRHCDRRA